VAEAEHDKAPHDPYLGTEVGGRYPILGLLGSGAMGSVYRSIQPLVERPVAIKVVQPGSLQADATGQRFLREARAVASVSHPAIVTLYDFGIDEAGTAYMVMEQVVGRSLREALTPPGLPLADLVPLVMEVLGALVVAHAAGLVHRDLKPENVMLLAEPTSHCRLKILDFGLAKLVGGGAAGPKITQAGMLYGTPGYMAPEQVLCGEIDARADVYAVGTILFEGLVGHLPFDDPNPMRAMRARLSAPVPSLPDWLPRDMDGVVQRAMAVQPEERFDSAHGMALALRIAAQSLPDARPDEGATSTSIPTLPEADATSLGVPVMPDPEEAPTSFDWSGPRDGEPPPVAGPSTEPDLPLAMPDVPGPLAAPPAGGYDAADQTVADGLALRPLPDAPAGQGEADRTTTSSRPLALPPDVEDDGESTRCDRTADELGTMIDVGLEDGGGRGGRRG